MKEPDSKTAHSRVSRAGQQTTRKWWDVVMADDSQSTEMVQMMAMTRQLNQGMMNLNACLTEVERKKAAQPSESSYVRTDGEVSSTPAALSEEGY